jgi:hypothetical protein
MLLLHTTLLLLLVCSISATSLRDTEASQDDNEPDDEIKMMMEKQLNMQIDLDDRVSHDQMCAYVG